MKIIKLKPERTVRETCWECDTVISLEESDVTVKIDFIGFKVSRVNLGAPDYLATWICPGCGKVRSCWLCNLPASWRERITARTPNIDLEYRELKKAEHEREARLNDEAECCKPVQSKFDKLLSWFSMDLK